MKTTRQAKNLDEAAKQKKQQNIIKEAKAPGQRHRKSCNMQETYQRNYEEMSQG
jgi:hypothetical protein